MSTKIAVTVAALGLMLASGCTPIGFIATVVAGDEQAKAAYTIPPRPTLVLVEDPENMLADTSLKSMLAQTVEGTVRDNVKAISFIPQQKLVDLQTHTGPEYPKMAVNRIGINVGADQVIQVWIESIAFNPQPGMVAPKATVRVKVVDAKTGQRLFPAVKPGQEANPNDTYDSLDVSLGYQNVDTDKPNAMDAVYKALVIRVGVEVSELFYKHTPREKPTTDS